MNKSYVYFMHAVGTSFYKIGWTSTNLMIRLRNVQICCPYEVRIVCLIETDSPKNIEQSLHSRYDKWRARGEWFELPVIGIEELYYIARDGLILDSNRLSEILSDERARANLKLTNRRRKRQGLEPIDISRNCQNPDCRKKLTGRQKVACSSACNQKVYRLRQKAA